MTRSIAEKARTGRRTALAGIRARLVTGGKPVPVICDNSSPVHGPGPTFRSVRRHEPPLLLTRRIDT